MKKSLLNIAFVGVLFLGLITAGTGQSMTIPQDYADKITQTEYPLIYKISASNGVVMGWGAFAGNYLTEIDGTIEITLVGFYDVSTWSGDIPSVPHFNVTFKDKLGNVNNTIANISNIDLGFLFTLNVGNFVPGVLAKMNWTQNIALALAEANTPAGAYSPNGTLTISDDGTEKTFSYSQNLECGNQNCTLKYDTTTGWIQSWHSEVFNYYLNANLVRTSEGDLKIDSWPYIGLVGFALIPIGIIIKRKTPRS